MSGVTPRWRFEGGAAGKRSAVHCVRSCRMGLARAQRIALIEAYFECKSYERCARIWRQKYPDDPIPSKDTLYQLVRRFRDTGSVDDRPRSGRPIVVTTDMVSDVERRMLQSPQKSVRRLWQQLGASRGSTHKALKALHLRAYRVKVVQELKPPDNEKRRHYCQWLRKFIRNNVAVLDKTFFSDEAWFHLSGFVNTQNTRIWATTNPHSLHAKPLHSQKIGVWCAVSRRRIVGPLFFESTVDGTVYRELIQQFVALLEFDERDSWFQQDSATCHTSNETMDMLREFFGDRLITKNLWPPRSPDLSIPDFYLWGYLKNKVYADNPHTIDELKTAITRTVQEVTPEILKRVSQNMRKRVQLCLQENGGHFEHLL